MEQIINTILEMDKKARDMEERAAGERNKLKDELEERKKELYRHYDESLTEILEMEKAKVNESFEAGKAEVQKSTGAILKTMEKLYEKKGDAWVDKIVREVTGEKK